jgi:hypothetical protein
MLFCYVCILNLSWKKNTNHINDFRELVINDLKLNDEGVYKCYYNSKLIVTIKLNVQSKLLLAIDSIDDGYDAYMIYVLSLSGVFSFLLFFHSVCKYFNDSNFFIMSQSNI